MRDRKQKARRADGTAGGKEIEREEAEQQEGEGGWGGRVERG